MIDVNQLTSLISAFRVETEKSAIKRAQVSCLLGDEFKELLGELRA